MARDLNTYKQKNLEVKTMKKLVAILVSVLFIVSVTGLCFAAEKAAPAAAAPVKADDKAAVKADDKAVKADDKAPVEKAEKKCKKAKKHHKKAAKKAEVKKEEAAPAPVDKK